MKNPRPVFRVGDRVRIVTYAHIFTIEKRKYGGFGKAGESSDWLTPGWRYHLGDSCGWVLEKNLINLSPLERLAEL